MATDPTGTMAAQTTKGVKDVEETMTIKYGERTEMHNQRSVPEIGNVYTVKDHMMWGIINAQGRRRSKTW